MSRLQMGCGTSSIDSTRSAIMGDRVGKKAKDKLKKQHDDKLKHKEEERLQRQPKKKE